MPKWDTQWLFPLVTKSADKLFGSSTVTISAGMSFTANYSVERIKLDEHLRAILGQRMKSASVVFTVTKGLAVGGTYTLAVARDSASLRTPAASGIALEFSIEPTSSSTTDSTVVSGAGLAMLQAVMDSKGMLWVQVRGKTTWPGPGLLVIAPTDSIGLQLSLLVTLETSN